MFRYVKPMDFRGVFRFVDANTWALNNGISMGTRVLAYRLSHRYHEIGECLEPHRAIVYKDCENDKYDFGDEIGYFVTTFESVKHWVKALNGRFERCMYLYCLEFSYSDLMVCPLNNELIQGFVRGKVEVKNRVILRG